MSDLTKDWIIELDDNQGLETPVWLAAWETWFIEDDEEADRIEREYTKQNKRLDMTPRDIQTCLDILNKNRPDKSKWNQIRLRNLQSGDIILCWVLR